MYSEAEKQILEQMKTKYISKAKEREYLSSTNIVLNRGRFNRKEDMLFHSMVLRFLNKSGLNLEDLRNSFLGLTPFPLREMATYIAHKLHFRTLYTVTYRIKRMYHPFYRKQWSHDEKMELLKFVRDNGRNWPAITRKFNCELENARIVLRCLLKERKKKDENKNDWSTIDEIKLLGYSLVYNFYSPNFITEHDLETVLADLENKKIQSYIDRNKVFAILKVHNDTGAVIDYDDIHFMSIAHHWQKVEFCTCKYLTANFKICQNVYGFKTFQDVYDVLVNLVCQVALDIEMRLNIEIANQKTNQSSQKNNENGDPKVEKS